MLGIFWYFLGFGGILIILYVSEVFWSLMGPAKPPVSSRVITEDDWHLGIVISIMVVSPRRAVSPPSISGPLQNIYSPFCRWKNNSPLAHRRNVTKNEWISPLMSQQIKRRTPAHTQTGIYKREPRKKEKGKKTHRYTLHLPSIVFFSYSF